MPPLGSATVSGGGLAADLRPGRRRSCHGPGTGPGREREGGPRVREAEMDFLRVDVPRALAFGRGQEWGRYGWNDQVSRGEQKIDRDPRHITSKDRVEDAFAESLCPMIESLKQAAKKIEQMLEKAKKTRPGGVQGSMP